ncbi:MAG: T9SS type A sorting domain-containing protein [Bacteroidetes bacterium]|nr:T9SS type A sorting domain-containing protein [Bacteroidota bacterium]
MFSRINLLVVLISFFAFSASAQKKWGPIADPVLGNERENNTGFGLAISGDGNTMVDGAANAPAGGTARGQVRVFSFDNGKWKQKGQTLKGNRNGIAYGFAVTTNYDGSKIAVGAPYASNSINGNLGTAYLYSWNASNSSWKLFDSIMGTDSFGYLGNALCMSPNGNSLAVGLPGAAGKGQIRGEVRVYDISSNSLKQTADTLFGSVDFEGFGSSLALSYGGDTLAVGSSSYGVGFDFGQGRVKVLKRNSTTWDTLVSFKGKAGGDYYGWDIDLSFDGSSIAIGAPKDFFGGDGYAEVYKLNGTNWSLQSSTLKSATSNDQYGFSVNLSATGNRLAVGAPNGNGYAVSGVEGKAVVYDWNSTNSKWETVGDTIYGRLAGNAMGFKTRLTASGDRLVASEPFDSTAKIREGRISTLEILDCSNFSVNLGNDRIGCDSIVLSSNVTANKYLWNTNETNASIQVKVSGTYVLAIEDTLRGCKAVDSVNITINPTPDVFIGNDTFICTGDSIRFSVDTNGVTSVLWNNQSLTNKSPFYKDSGAYYVMVLKEGCIGTDTINLGLLNKPTINLGDDRTVCEPFLLQPFTRIQEFTADYIKWQDNSDLGSFGVDKSGTYTVEISIGGCVNKQEVIITLASYPKLELGPDQYSCQGAIEIDATAAGATTYEWDNGLKAAKRTINETGTYSVTAGNGTCQISDTIDVYIDSFVLDLGEDRGICVIDSIGTEIEGANYKWSNGASTQYITIDKAGTYILESSLNGCSDKDTLVIEVFDSFALDLGSDTSLCANIELDAGVADAQYLWNTGETTKSIEKQGLTRYWVEVTKGACVISDTIVLSEWNLVKEHVFAHALLAVPDSNTLLYFDGNTDFVINRLVNGELKEKSRITIDRNNVSFGSGIHMPDSNTIAYVELYQENIPQLVVKQYVNGSWVNKGQKLTLPEGNWNVMRFHMINANTVVISYEDPKTKDDVTVVYYYIGFAWFPNELNTWTDKDYSNYWNWNNDKMACFVSAGKLTSNNYLKIRRWAGTQWVDYGIQPVEEFGQADIAGITWVDDNTIAILVNYLVGRKKVGYWNYPVKNEFLITYTLEAGKWVRSTQEFVTYDALGLNKERDYLRFSSEPTIFSNNGMYLGCPTTNTPYQIFKRKGNNWEGQTIYSGYDANRIGFPDSTHYIASNSKTLRIYRKGCTEPVSIKETTKQTYQLQVYPNPSNGRFTIKSKQAEGFRNVELYNLSGQLIWSTNQNNLDTQMEVNLEDVNDGIYILKAQFSNSQLVQKVLIEH